MPVDLGFVFGCCGLFRDVERDLLALTVVVADVGDDEVRIAIERERRQVFPVVVVGFPEIGFTELGAGQVERKQLRLAVVVDRPESAGLSLRTGKSAGFVDLRIFEAPGNLEEQRCRLLRIGAAGKQQ